LAAGTKGAHEFGGEVEMLRGSLVVLFILILTTTPGWSQSTPVGDVGTPGVEVPPDRAPSAEWNQRLNELVRAATPASQEAVSPQDYRIGPDDMLSITILDAPDISRSVRVSAGGEISLPLLGVIKAADLTPRELELVLAELLRRTYMKDPHVSIQVTEMQSHSISVMGAVRQPGVFQMRGDKTLLEVLSMAGGLADDAGDTVLVMRKPDADDGHGSGVGPKLGESQAASEVTQISLRQLLQSGDPRFNVHVHPGDIVKVQEAGIVYVVGEVKKPGGFPITKGERLTVLQVVALGEGLTPTAAKGSARIIRTDDKGQRAEIPVDVGKILKGKAPDLPLMARDILFVPNSASKSAARGTVDALVRVVSFRRIPY
jgi:polysaccharide biosynthesis/export protein